jgi:hypothetical protein
MVLLFRAAGGRESDNERLVVQKRRSVSQHIRRKSLQQSDQNMRPKREAVAGTLVGDFRATAAAR